MCIICESVYRFMVYTVVAFLCCRCLCLRRFLLCNNFRIPPDSRMRAHAGRKLGAKTRQPTRQNAGRSSMTDEVGTTDPPTRAPGNQFKMCKIDYVILDTPIY